MRVRESKAYFRAGKRRRAAYRRPAFPVVAIAIVLVGAVVLGGSAIHLPAPRTDGDARSRADAGAFLLKSDRSVALLDSARWDLFGYRMDRAEASLRRLGARHDGTAAAWFHLTAAALHKAMMSDRDVHFEAFEARRDTLLQALRDQPPSRWTAYMRAETDLWRAAAAAKQERYVRGALAARAAYRRFARLVEEHPQFYEPYKGLGLLHLSIASMPASYRFVLQVLGYGGSVTEGLEELNAAHQRSRYNREEAGIFLAFTQVMLHLSAEEGLAIIDRMHARDVESALLAHLYGFMLITNRQTREAADVLERAAARSATSDYFYIDYIDFYLAEALFRNDRFQDATTHFRRYLARHQGKALKASAHLRLGLALEMQGERAAAMEHYRRVQAARAFDTDEASRRAADRRIRAPLSPVDRQLLLGQNAFDSGRYDEADRLLRGILERGAATDDQRAEAAYRLGRVFHAQRRYPEAVAEYRAGIALQKDPRAKWAPWGWFHIAKILEAQGKEDAARDAYRRALEYGKHDYHQALEQGVRAALELMDRSAEVDLSREG